MKKFFFFSVLIFSLVAVAQGQSNDLIRVYKQALVLNEGRFTDVDLIQIGDTVLFPAHYGPGLEAWVADEPSDGKHDSFWRLSEKYVTGSLATVPADTVKVKASNSEPTAQAKIGTPWYYWLFLFLAGALTIAFLLIVFMPNHFRRPVNPDRYQPVGGNIDAMSRQQTLNTVMSRYLQSGERLVSFRRGTLANTLGKRRFQVEMQFGDNVRRNVWLNVGERVSTAIIEDANGSRRVQHLRNACSNGFGSGSFALPNGWFINYDESEESGRVIPETEEQEPEGQQSPSPVPVPTIPSGRPNGLDKLAHVIENLNLDLNNMENSIYIHFKENSDGVELSIQTDRQEQAENEL